MKKKSYRVRLSLLLVISVFGLSACSSSTRTVSPTPFSTATSTPPASQQPETAPVTTDIPSTLEAGQWGHLFYHAGLEQVVLVNGGPEKGKPSTDPLELWSWDGEHWSLLAADENGPVWRNWAAVAYDSTRNVLIMYGGLQSPNKKFAETWEWDGSKWTQITGSNPGNREGAMMTYDAARMKTILFGGAIDLDIKGDTWEWDTGQWELVSETGPAPRFPGGMVFDPVSQEILLTSGHFAETTGAFVDFGDLWAWNGTTWREIVLSEPKPGHGVHTALVFDPQTEHILLFGGGIETFMNDIWEWDGTSWMKIPTSTNMPARSGHTVAYDAVRDRFVFFGGVERPGGIAMDDTWEWNRVDWMCVANCR